MLFEQSDEAIALVDGAPAGRVVDPILPVWASGGRVCEVVPDGVARVELVFAGGRAEVVDVVDNVWESSSPDDDSSPFPALVRWFDAIGRQLRCIS
jgi:hypothetical protein